jgi:hypothetical protein
VPKLLERTRRTMARRPILTLSEQIDLSAQTARLVATPDPRGKPGGPGLYDVKGMGHSNYFQHLVKALIRHGMLPGKAYAVAYGSLRRWARGGGNVTPEVKAASIAALAEEKAKGLVAKAKHGKV